ncbi:type I-E CRISPR-associated protein Cse2/CasB [Lacticaseibacillus baoqingensis]|uniref:Type I-E CRISPR-associated protein Cse2/CasB n=1 Tax=Lacticaseibacillus baoqingensis TaxID=2486013 RepID=A0ABW4E875_9LACO|nr:type I-E CRISPR-associated protein Cse2/CasB [Lacticaseibacillus baoqingensis]
MRPKIRNTTAHIIQILYGNGNMDKAVLAGLRHSITLMSPQAQVAWPVIMANLAEGDLSRNGEPTAAETAVFTALKLYARHQQGNQGLVYGSVKDDEGISLMAALAQMSHKKGNQTRIDNRVNQLLKVTNINSVINALSHLVDIVQTSQQPIDYAQLAEDLYWFQQSYEQANRVRLFWGQIYYRPVKALEEEK